MCSESVTMCSAARRQLLGITAKPPALSNWPWLIEWLWSESFWGFDSREKLLLGRKWLEEASRCRTRLSRPATAVGTIKRFFVCCSSPQRARSCQNKVTHFCFTSACNCFWTEIMSMCSCSHCSRFCLVWYIRNLLNRLASHLQKIYRRCQRIVPSLSPTKMTCIYFYVVKME